jgi:hypothetical protein
MIHGHGYWHLKPKTAANNGFPGDAGARTLPRLNPSVGLARSPGELDKFPVKTRESHQDLGSFITTRAGQDTQ